MFDGELPKFIRQSNASGYEGLSVNEQTLFALLSLVVDIQFRQKYVKSFDYNNVKDYSEGIQSNEVLADQVSPVDNGLLGFDRRELFGL